MNFVDFPRKSLTGHKCIKQSYILRIIIKEFKLKTETKTFWFNVISAQKSRPLFRKKAETNLKALLPRESAFIPHKVSKY